ncbi:hypothetical protein HYPSUDRAFT_588176 [Hypholoma sublateritium FD-334 SS-4]|uniref:Uncharacterized protein n=1 Tax=Hypholoma sublateritium (strain FD-334 SS-4) TaxID=945553 RepID=A0A0D2MII6_HYPSF|nr:hypothetical protein HYPSUDRAFT_588176 [Hypholoma sublateritium FD-334 SS-4]
MSFVFFHSAVILPLKSHPPVAIFPLLSSPHCFSSRPDITFNTPTFALAPHFLVIDLATYFQEHLIIVFPMSLCLCLSIPCPIISPLKQFSSHSFLFLPLPSSILPDACPPSRSTSPEHNTGVICQDSKFKTLEPGEYQKADDSPEP